MTKIKSNWQFKIFSQNIAVAAFLKIVEDCTINRNLVVYQVFSQIDFTYYQHEIIHLPKMYIILYF